MWLVLLFWTKDIRQTTKIKTPIGFYIVKATSPNVLGEDLRIVELEEVGEREIDG